MSNILPVHSPLGASTYHRWRACPGSIREIKKAPPQQSSIYADEGTKAHEIAADLLLGKQPKEPVPEEMLEAIMVYVNYMRVKDQVADILVEHRFDLSKIYPMLYGTADGVVYKAGIKELEVVDYKHGQGIPVEVIDNEQLQYYALGALLSLPNLRVHTVKITIVQPRCYHADGPIRSWEIPAITLLDFAADLVEAAKATEAPDAPLSAGDHCRFCPASAGCPAITSKSLAMAKQVFSPTLSYDPAKLSDTLIALPQIEAWCESVRKFAYSEANKGHAIPGFKLVAKRAHRKWKKGTDCVALSMSFGMDESKFFDEPEIMSPAQIEKILPKEKKPLLARFVESISSGTSLVEEADGRPPVNSLEAAKNVFETISE